MSIASKYIKRDSDALGKDKGKLALSTCRSSTTHTLSQVCESERGRERESSTTHTFSLVCVCEREFFHTHALTHSPFPLDSHVLTDIQDAIHAAKRQKVDVCSLSLPPSLSLSLSILLPPSFFFSFLSPHTSSLLSFHLNRRLTAR